MSDKQKCPECNGKETVKRAIVGTTHMCDVACPTCNGTGTVPEEPLRCECGACFELGGEWHWRKPIGHPVQLTYSDKHLSEAHCPSCGCRLSVESGQPRVGEPYADLERDARRFREWQMRLQQDTWMSDGEVIADVGCRLSVESGQPGVGPNNATLRSAVDLMALRATEAMMVGVSDVALVRRTARRIAAEVVAEASGNND